ncbi:hypothetical protein P4O66_012062, partial [Electrophorus voltai]
ARTTPTCCGLRIESSCYRRCVLSWAVPLQSTSIESPDADKEYTVGQEYRVLAEVFSAVRATQLPPHREGDCAITLREGLYHLSVGSIPSPRRRPRSVVAYIDDILIYSASFDQHIREVCAVLGTIFQNHLYCKLEKCKFHHREYLSQTTHGPTSGTSKTPQMGSAAEKAFEELKNAFATAPILAQPEPKKPFIVEVDVSDIGVGAVQSQARGKEEKLRPIAYFSRKLSLLEQNYSVGDQELLAMKLTLEEWRHWLEGAQHPLRTGERNIRADALSQHYNAEAQSTRPEPVLSPSCSLALITWDLDHSVEAVNLPKRQHHGALTTWAHTWMGTGHPGSMHTAQLLSARYW